MSNTILKAIESAKDAFESERDYKREANYALQAIKANDYMSKIVVNNLGSLTEAMKNIAYSDITLNPSRKLSYLIPRDGKVVIDLSYKGIIEKSDIQWAKAEIVREKDHFNVGQIGERPEHDYNPFSKQRGEIVGAYCVAKLHNGDYLTDVMDIGDINAIKNRSKTSSNGPWKTDFAEMCKKTVVRRGSKYWPGSIDIGGDDAISDSEPTPDPEKKPKTVDDIVDTPEPEPTPDPEPTHEPEPEPEPEQPKQEKQEKLLPDYPEPQFDSFWDQWRRSIKTASQAEKLITRIENNNKLSDDMKMSIREIPNMGAVSNEQ